MSKKICCHPDPDLSGEGSLTRKFSTKFKGFFASLRMTINKTRYKFILVLGVVVYCLIRLTSFLTYTHKSNDVIGVILIVLFVFFCAKNLKLGWIILIGELVLGGAGHFFEFGDLILRTWFLGIFGFFWLCTWLYTGIKINIPCIPTCRDYGHLSGNCRIGIQKSFRSLSRLCRESMLILKYIKQKNFRIPFPRHIFLSLIILGIVILWSTINGFQNNHASVNIAQDAILFCFLLLIFPALEYKDFAKKPFTLMIKTWIIGSAIFSSITFFIYSSGIGNLPDTYYHWFRNIAAGKITDLGSDFFRIVLPEHIFIIPLILILTAFLIRSVKNKKLWALLMCAALVLTFNFSRIYFIGFATGILILAFRNSFKRWFLVSAITAGIFALIFSSSFFTASRGKSFGLELLGVRIAGASAPAAETSGAIRLAIIPDALKQIHQNPWFGSGLGAVVSYQNPTTGESVTRTQFDWGYLEMLAELGITGTVVFLIFYFQLLWRIGRIAYASEPKISAENSISLYQGIFAGGISLLIMNITTPALFHGFGILYMVFMMVVAYGDDSGSAIKL